MPTDPTPEAMAAADTIDRREFSMTPAAKVAAARIIDEEFSTVRQAANAYQSMLENIASHTARTCGDASVITMHFFEHSILAELAKVRAALKGDKPCPPSKK